MNEKRQPLSPIKIIHRSTTKQNLSKSYYIHPNTNSMKVGKWCPIFIALFLVCSTSFSTYADRVIENDDIPSWADGSFHGTLKINGENYGNIEGYISLKRSDMSGNISGIWKNGENELPFKGMFYHHILICFASFPFPIFGFIDFDDTNFNAYLWHFGKKMQASGTYDASMLPLPGGNYSVGLEVKHLIDESRDEKITENPDDKREMMLYLWYPAEGGGERAEYMKQEEFAYLFKESPIPLFWIPEDAYEYVRTHSFINATPADGVFPLVIFSHGYRGYPAMYTSMIENLVSHGFIVAAITHPYVAGVTVFPDGRVIELPDLSNKDSEYVQWYFDTAFEEVIEDIDYVCDYLLQLNATSTKWSGKIDADRIGIYGHSFGGGAAAMACYDNSHIKAGLAMDGYFRGDVFEEGMTKPFFMFFVEGRFESDDALQNFWEVLKGDTYRASILGSAHQDFTDLPLLFPHFMPNIPRSMIPGFGSIDGKQLVKIVNTFTLAFFDVYLNGKSVDELLSLEDEFDEVIFDHK